MWIPTLIAAVVLAGFFAVRQRSVLRFSLLPRPIVLFASGFFWVVQAAVSLGLTGLLSNLVGTGDSAGSLLRLAGVAVGGSNIVNNLPAYLALEPAAGTPRRLAALLVGSNAGPLITPWASLATLLWHERLTALDVNARWSRYILLGCIVVPSPLSLRYYCFTQRGKPVGNCDDLSAGEALRWGGPIYPSSGR